MTRFEVVGAFESSFHPPPETLCEFIYDTCGDGVLKAQTAGSGRLVGHSEIIASWRLFPFHSRIPPAGVLSVIACNDNQRLSLVLVRRKELEHFSHYTI